MGWQHGWIWILAMFSLSRSVAARGLSSSDIRRNNLESIQQFYRNRCCPNHNSYTNTHKNQDRNLYPDRFTYAARSNLNSNTHINQDTQPDPNDHINPDAQSDPNLYKNTAANLNYAAQFNTAPIRYPLAKPDASPLKSTGYCWLINNVYFIIVVATRAANWALFRKSARLARKLLP